MDNFFVSILKLYFFFLIRKSNYIIVSREMNAVLLTLRIHFEFYFYTLTSQVFFDDFK